MGDIADRADAEIEMMMREAIARTKPVPVKHDGECYCGDRLGVRFCGTDCRDMFEREERAKQRAGR
jgi:hypothetical protein